jgi:phosphoserine phosphatase
MRTRPDVKHEGRVWRHKPPPRTRFPIRLVCFDMDGVLIDVGSSWVMVHKAFGTRNEESLARFMRGEIDDMEFIRLDVALWTRERKVHSDEIRDILKDAPLMSGAYECVRELHRCGVRTAIVSGGIDLAAHAVANKLGIDVVYANGLLADEDGFLTGEGVVRTPLRDKGVAVRLIQKELGVPPEATASVGNSFPDIGMFAASGLGIAFRPDDDLVQKAAHATIFESDLRRVLAEVLATSS